MHHSLTKTVMLPTLIVGAIALSSCRSMHEDHATTTSTTAAHAAEPRTGAEQAMESSSKPMPASYKKGSLLSARLAYPTGDIDTSALMVEKLSPVEVVAGQPFEYEMVVTNLTGLPLENVVVTETKDANFAIVSSEPKAATSASAYSWDLGTIGAKQSRSIRVDGKASGTDALKSCATVSYSSALCSTIPVVQPALKLACSGPAEVLACDEIVYSYVVTNTGTGTARDVVLDVSLPEGLTDENGRSSVSRKIGSLEGGRSQEFRLLTRASRTGAFEHKAVAKGEGGLSTEASACSTIVRKPQLKIEKTGTKKSFAGRTLKYQITVSNVGDGIARDAVLEDTLPTNVGFKSAGQGGRHAAGKVRWNLGDLAPKASKTFDVSVSADAIGRVVNRAMASAYCAEPVNAMVETEVVGIPAILLEVVDLEDPIEVGADATYVITVTNQGSAPGTNIGIEIGLPDNTSYVTSSGATSALAGAGVGGKLKMAPLASLAPKQQVSWRVVIKGNTAADARFAVSMTSDQLTSPVDETEATNFY